MASFRIALLVVAFPLAGHAAPALGLLQALERGWAANPSLAIARANLERAQALIVQSRATWLPTVSAGGVFTQLEGDRQVSGRVTTAASTIAGTLSVQAPLFALPRWLSTGQASADRDAAAFDVASVQRDVAALVGRAWLQVRLQQRVVEVAERALALSRDELELARARNAGGISTRLDLARAERELADNEARVALTRAELSVAREALGALLGEPGPVDITGEPALPQIPSPAALDHRPDLAAADARVAAAQRRADESWADYLPTLTAALGPVLQAPAIAPTPTLGFQAQVVASVPIYDGSARYGVQRERSALLTAASAARDALTLAAGAQLRSAQAQLEQRLKATEAARRSAALAREASDLAKLAWSGGTSTNLEVIEAERAARDAETNASVILNAAETARLDVLLAVGALAPAGKP